MHIVLEGGGVRSAWSAAVLERLHAAHIRVDSVIGASTGSLNAAYFCADQIAELITLWRDYVSGTDIISPARLVQPWGRPAIDFDTLVDHLMVRVVPLDRERACSGRPRLYVTATDIERNEQVVAIPTPADLLLWLKASAALPVGYNKVVTIGRHTYMDGGMLRSVPFEPALPDAPPKPPVLVIITRPTATLKPAPSWWQRALIRTITPAHARASTLDQHNLHNNLMRRLEAARDAGQLLLVEPRADMPIQRLTRDKVRIAEGMAQGRAAGEALVELLRKPAAPPSP